MWVLKDHVCFVDGDCVNDVGDVCDVDVIHVDHAADAKGCRRCDYVCSVDEVKSSVYLHFVLEKTFQEKANR